MDRHKHTTDCESFAAGHISRATRCQTCTSPTAAQCVVVRPQADATEHCWAAKQSLTSCLASQAASVVGMHTLDEYEHSKLVTNHPRSSLLTPSSSSRTSISAPGIKAAASLLRRQPTAPIAVPAKAGGDKRAVSESSEGSVSASTGSWSAVLQLSAAGRESAAGAGPLRLHMVSSDLLREVAS